MSHRIIIDELSESQMQKVQNYLSLPPNKPHPIHFSGFSPDPIYGQYVNVVVGESRVSVSRFTAKRSSSVYRSVSFSIPNICGTDHCVNDSKTQLEQRRVWEGLVSLLGSFVSQE